MPITIGIPVEHHEATRPVVQDVFLCIISGDLAAKHASVHRFVLSS